MTEGIGALEIKKFFEWQGNIVAITTSSRSKNDQSLYLFDRKNKRWSILEEGLSEASNSLRVVHVQDQIFSYSQKGSIFVLNSISKIWQPVDNNNILSSFYSGDDIDITGIFGNGRMMFIKDRVRGLFTFFLPKEENEVKSASFRPSGV